MRRMYRFPRLSRARERSAGPWPGTCSVTNVNYVTSSRCAQGLQTICAACPLLISSSFQRYPVGLPASHLYSVHEVNSTDGNLLPHRAIFRLKSSSLASSMLDHSASQPRLARGCLPTRPVHILGPRNYASDIPVLMLEIQSSIPRAVTWYQPH